MPDAALNDVWQVSFRGVYNAQRIILTQTYQVTQITPPITDGNAALVLLNAVRAGVGGFDLIESAYLACMPAEYELQVIRAQNVKPNRRVYHEVIRTQPGTHAEVADTGNLAAVVTMRTDFAGRSQVSNRHIGPIPSTGTVQTLGALTGAYKTLLSTLATALLQSWSEAIPTITFTPCILHPTDIVPPNVDKITSAIVGETVRVMRRRTLRIGE